MKTTKNNLLLKIVNKIIVLKQGDVIKVPPKAQYVYWPVNSKPPEILQFIELGGNGIDEDLETLQRIDLEILNNSGAREVLKQVRKELQEGE